jgi:hypothetical protein
MGLTIATITVSDLIVERFWWHWLLLALTRVAMRQFYCSYFSASFSDILCVLTIFHLPASSIFIVNRTSAPRTVTRVPSDGTLLKPNPLIHLQIYLDIPRVFFLRKQIRLMKNLTLRSPCEEVGGLVYFGRMVDKIRAYATGKLPPEYQEKLGKGLDEHCVDFLGVNYNRVVQFVNDGLSDGAILQSCFGMGRHHPVVRFTYGTNSCVSEDGMMNFRRRWKVRKKKEQCFPGRRYRQCFNSSMPMKGDS